MARLPEIKPQGSVIQGISSPNVDRSGEIIAASVREIGYQVINTGIQLAERESRFNLALAESDFLTAAINSSQEVQKDLDNWENWDKQHQENMQKALDGASARIKSPRDRVLFEAQAKTDMARSSVEMQNNAKVREVDQGRGNLSSALDAMIREATNTNYQPMRDRLIGVSGDMIRSAADAGYISAVEAETMTQDWQTAYATQSVGMMNDDDQMRVLQKPEGTAARFLTPAVRSEMYRAAESRSKTDRINAAAIMHTDQIMRQYDTLGQRKEALAAVSNIEDPAEQLATRDMVNGRFAELKTIKNEQDDFNSEAAYDMAEAGVDIEVIKRSDAYQNAPAAAQTGIIERYRQVKEGVEPVTDEVLYYEWTQKSPAEKLEHNVHYEYRHVMDDWHYNDMVQDQKAIREKAETGGSSLGATKVPQSEIKRTLIANGIKEPTTNIGKQRWAQFSSEVGKRANAITADGKTKMTPALQQEVIDGVLREQVFVDDKIIGQDTAYPISMLTEEQREDVYMNYADIPEVTLTRLQNIVKSEGLKNVSERAYSRAAASYAIGDYERMYEELRKTYGIEAIQPGTR